MTDLYDVDVTDPEAVREAAGPPWTHLVRAAVSALGGLICLWLWVRGWGRAYLMVATPFAVNVGLGIRTWYRAHRVVLRSQRLALLEEGERE